MNLDSFFSPKSIAIVGASPKKGKLGNVLIENIRRDGWKGKMYLINPKHAKSAGYLASLKDIKKPVDLVLVAIPAPFVIQSIEEGATAKPAIKNFAVISSGFKESGTEGKVLEKNLESLAKKFGLNILGPNCLGFANPFIKLNATFTDVKLQKGNIAIVSQSGALAVALLDWASGKKIGFSKIISIGNKTVIDENSILNFLANDKNTKAIALYLEDIKAGRNFIDALAKITPRKPVIILKAGKTTAGQKAVSSHTGSLAQNQDIIDAVFERLNVIGANGIEEFQDIIFYLNSNQIPQKKDIVVLTNAGGPGVMASDFIGKSKIIKVLNFSQAFKSDLKADLPSSASVENPIDVIGDAPPERYQSAIGRIAKTYPANTVMVILTPQNQSQPERVAEILAKTKKTIPNISACFMGGEKIKRANAVLENSNIPNFSSPEKALVVIEKLTKYSNAQKLELIQHATETRHAQLAFPKSKKMLSWNESEKLFKKYGVQLAKSFSFESFDDLKNTKIPYPCALKTDDQNIAHRLEKNAVALNIQNEKELRQSFGKIKKSSGAKHFLAQPMAETGLELIIGMKLDPSFGPVVLCGMGGSFTEIFKDKVILIPPFDQNYIKERLSALTIFPILKGFRGKSGYNLDEISKTILAVSRISADFSDISEIDINPLMIYNNGRRGQILDAKIFIQNI